MRTRLVSKTNDMLVALLAVCFNPLAGCMMGTPNTAKVLLEQDHLRMTNAQLVDYDQRLSDELFNSSRNSSGDLGISFSTRGSSLSYECELTGGKVAVAKREPAGS